jgi:hypothetical protein
MRDALFEALKKYSDRKEGSKEQQQQMKDSELPPNATDDVRIIEAVQ